jgi:hypothetical protein
VTATDREAPQRVARVWHAPGRFRLRGYASMRGARRCCLLRHEPGWCQQLFLDRNAANLQRSAQLSMVGYGINLSSRDGWTKDATLTYKSTAHGHPICGSSGYPGVAGYIGVIGVHSTNLS